MLTFIILLCLHYLIVAILLRLQSDILNLLFKFDYKICWFVCLKINLLQQFLIKVCVWTNTPIHELAIGADGIGVASALVLLSSNKHDIFDLVFQNETKPQKNNSFWRWQNFSYLNWVFEVIKTELIGIKLNLCGANNEQLLSR